MPNTNEVKQSEENKEVSNDQHIDTDLKVSDKPTPHPSEDSTQENSENIHYEGETCIYTDPSSKFQFIWDSVGSKWVPRSSNIKNSDSVKKSENDDDDDDDDDDNDDDDDISGKVADNNDTLSKKYRFDGESYTYTNDETGITYKYDNKNNKWIEKGTESKSSTKLTKETDNVKESKEVNSGMKEDMSHLYSYEGDTHLYTDPSDGTVYIWDKEKSAWFPKVDEDFLAYYQMNYGFTETKVEDKKEDEAKNMNEKQTVKEESKKRGASKEPTWFEMDDQHNTKVYVSNLPLDITEEEFVSIMQKCGLVMRDIDSGKMKVKLYTETGSSQLKGDALCTYIKMESVDLALKFLDGYELRGKKLRVERAKFQMKGKYDPTLKPRKRRKKDKEKIKKIQEKLFDWRPDQLRGERAKHERVVIVKNLFDPKIFEKEVSLLLEYQQDLREECSKCGNVRKVVIYDRNPEGVAQITFSDAEEADICIKLLNGRWFGQRKITAETWDGKTKYKIVETEEEAKKRLQQWDTFLEGDKSSSNKKSADISEKVKVEESCQEKSVDEENLKT